MNALPFCSFLPVALPPYFFKCVPSHALMIWFLDLWGNLTFIIYLLSIEMPRTTGVCPQSLFVCPEWVQHLVPVGQTKPKQNLIFIVDLYQLHLSKPLPDCPVRVAQGAKHGSKKLQCKEDV